MQLVKQILKTCKYIKQKELLNLFKDLSDTILTDKTLILSRDKNENENENENEDKDETMSQNEKNKIIKGKNDTLDEIIDKSISFEEQIKSLKKREDLKGFWTYNDFGDKELKSKYFKIELADMSNDIDKKLFQQIFGLALIKLAAKLINTTNKKENEIIVKNINQNKEKIYEMGPLHDWVIQPNSQRINLIHAYKLILKFNETIQLDLV